MAPSQFTVAILPLGDVSARQIEFTGEVLRREFGVRTTVLPPKELSPAYFNADRKRYNAYKLLDDIFFQLPVDVQRVVAIAGGSLENGLKEPVIGSGAPYHRAAIYGTSRLSNQTEREIFFYPIIVHEFGHTLGLGHCNQPECGMNAPYPSVELCVYCRRWADRELTVKLGSAEERFSLAESYRIKNYLPQAVELYREAIRYASRPEPLYYHRLSDALYLLGQHDEVEKSLALAVEHSDDEEHFFYNFGLIHLKKDPKQAEEYFTKAIATTKDSQKMHGLIGQAYREIRHDINKASEYYKKYLRLGGNDQDVVDWLLSRSRLDMA